LNELSVLLESLFCLFELSLQLDLSELLSSQHTSDDFIVNSAEISDCNLVYRSTALQEIFIMPTDLSTDLLQCLIKRDAQIFDGIDNLLFMLLK
jgi:hypothetical protein